MCSVFVTQCNVEEPDICLIVKLPVLAKQIVIEWIGFERENGGLCLAAQRKRMPADISADINNEIIIVDADGIQQVIGDMILRVYSELVVNVFSYTVLDEESELQIIFIAIGS